MREPMCQAVSRSTGKPCQQPERWLELSPERDELGVPTLEHMRVCQVHGRQLERQGWSFLRELHPVPGIPERTPQ